MEDKGCWSWGWGCDCDCEEGGGIEVIMRRELADMEVYHCYLEIAGFQKNRLVPEVC